MRREPIDESRQRDNVIIGGVWALALGFFLGTLTCTSGCGSTPADACPKGCATGEVCARTSEFYCTAGIPPVCAYHSTGPTDQVELAQLTA